MIIIVMIIIYKKSKSYFISTFTYLLYGLSAYIMTRLIFFVAIVAYVVCVCMWTCVWKPKVDIECLPDCSLPYVSGPEGCHFS